MEDNKEKDFEEQNVHEEESGVRVQQGDGFRVIPLKGLIDNWFIDYASSVILDRAVPEINDGLKPVQRRILHSMKELEDGRYNKVANIVGNTMKYHPHGDASIGDALVNLGQKDLLIDTQGNWGNVLTGDPAAAPRYIEARLSKFALDVVYNPKTTEWKFSYDGRNKEPVTLPPPSPTNPDIVIPTVKPTDSPTAPTEEDTTGVPYNPSVSEIPEVPAAPSSSTNGTPLCPAQLVQLLPSGHINEADKNFTCAKMEVRLSNKGSSTMRIFPNGNVTVSNITGYDRELSLINSNDVAVPYIDIPAGGTVHIRFKVLGEATLFSTQKYNQETTVHFTFYYGNTIYDGTCTAGVAGVKATKR